MGGPGINIEEVKNKNKALTDEKVATVEEKNKQIKQNDQDGQEVNPPVRSKQGKEKLSKDVLEIAEQQPQPSVKQLPKPHVEEPDEEEVVQPHVAESDEEEVVQTRVEEEPDEEESRVPYTPNKLKAYKQANVGKALAKAKEVKGKTKDDLLPEEQQKLDKEATKQNILGHTKKASKIFHLVKSGLGVLNQINVGLGLYNKNWKGSPGNIIIDDSMYFVEVTDALGGLVAPVSKIIKDMKDVKNDSKMNRLDKAVDDIDLGAKQMMKISNLLLKGVGKFGSDKDKERIKESNKGKTIASTVVGGLSSFANIYRFARLGYRQHRLKQYKASLLNNQKAGVNHLDGLEVGGFGMEGAKLAMNLSGLISNGIKLSDPENKNPGKKWTSFAFDTANTIGDFGMSVYGMVTDKKKEGNKSGIQDKATALYQTMIEKENSIQEAEQLDEDPQFVESTTSSHSEEKITDAIADYEEMDVTLFAGLDVKMGSLMSVKTEAAFIKVLAEGFK